MLKLIEEYMKKMSRENTFIKEETMINHKLGRNILVAGGFLTLLAALIPWRNKDSIGQVLFGMQSVLFFIGTYLQQKKINKANK